VKKTTFRQPLSAFYGESLRCGDVIFFALVNEIAGQGHYTPSCRILDLPLLASNFRRDFQRLYPTPHLTPEKSLDLLYPEG
jgi:hypothetical protein